MAIPIAVLGAGSFGTCLAVLCGREHDVALWARDPTLAAAIDAERRNPRYLRDVEVPERVRATADLRDALEGSELVICAVPSLGVRDVMGRADPFVPDEAIVVSTVKGLELDTYLRMDEVFREVLSPVHHPRLAYLSGPAFAAEIASGRPTAVTIACAHEAYAISVQESLSTPWFRCYTATDVIGVELGGALKNVVAIAVGVCDGLELGPNARAAVMTRGLREITRLGVAMGADALTFLGLSGMGDLVLTCTGDQSRNRRVGVELGRGRALAEILGEMDEVAEGVRTAEAAWQLAQRHDVEMPIVEVVRDVLRGATGPAQGAERLMTRQLKSEYE